MDNTTAKKHLAKIQDAHPVGAKRWYYGNKAEVIGYEQDDKSGYVYVICNVEDPYKGGFRTKYVTPNTLKK